MFTVFNRLTKFTFGSQKFSFYVHNPYTTFFNLTSENSHVNVMKLLKIALFTHLIQHVITLLVLHMREFISIAIIIWTFSKKGPNSISKVALKWNPSDGKRQRGRSKETNGEKKEL